ncbi:MAG: secretion system protein [Betaproteobacteria bacterium RIFCSPLOWO2_12_FULL_64_23]|nr:MAG: secretion system protein [Betaproteobacteria bacterium RIFCSPLOWO2_12_FULL_64_23]
MALYSYKAIDDRGKSLMGQIEAINLIDLELRLQRMGLDLVVGGPARRRASMFKGAIGRPELINFCFHLEQLTAAGVPILESLTDLRDSVENPRFREVISGLIESIQGGQGLSAAMADYTDVFPAVFASLIRAGEETGRMSQVLKHLAENLKWEDELIAQTKKLMIYPAFVGSIVLIVTMFLMIYLVPQMIGFIKGTGQAIPLQTRILIHVSGFFIDYWWAVLAAPVIAFAGIKLAIARSPGFRYRFDDFKLHLPLLGPIQHKIILSRFASIFAMMYSAGITILDCIKTSEEVAGNLVIKEALERAGQQIAEGKNVSTAFQDVGLFPPLVIRMLRVGESSGKLDNALLNVSYFYNRDVKDAIGKVEVMIEPAMTVILGALLGWVMLSVLGPIYDSISKIKF